MKALSLNTLTTSVLLWTATKSTLRYYCKIDVEYSFLCFRSCQDLITFLVYDFMSYFHTFDRFGFDIHTNFDRRIVILKFKTSKCWFCETIYVLKHIHIRGFASILSYLCSYWQKFLIVIQFTRTPLEKQTTYYGNRQFIWRPSKSVLSLK